MGYDPAADIIIPTFRPGAEFMNELRRLALQFVKVNKLIIVNTESGSWNKEFEEVIPDTEVIHIPKSEFNHGHARNLGASHSTADVIIFMTQDAVPADRELIGRLTAPVKEGKAAASYARQMPKKDADPIESFTRRYNYPEQSCLKTEADLETLGVKTFFCSNVCAAYDHRVFDELGGFDEPLEFNEDMIYAGKLIENGYAIAYQADAKVFHSHNFSGIQQFRRNREIGRTQSRYPELFEKYPSEGAGISLVKNTAAHLVKSGKPQYVPQLVYRSGMKYLGYLFGKHTSGK